MIRPGTVAWASAAPGLSPPSPHPLICVLGYPNGKIGIAYITHSADLLRVGVPLTRRVVPSAFRERGGPLTDENSVVALVDHYGHRRVVNAEPLASNRLSIGNSILSLSHIVQLPEPEWQPLLISIRQALGLPAVG